MLNAAGTRFVLNTLALTISSSLSRLLYAASSSTRLVPLAAAVASLPATAAASDSHFLCSSCRLCRCAVMVRTTSARCRLLLPFTSGRGNRASSLPSTCAWQDSQKRI